MASRGHRWCARASGLIDDARATVAAARGSGKENDMLSFLLGAVTGAVAATYWRDELNRVTSQRMPEFRSRLADNVEGAERTIVDAVGRFSQRARTLLRGQPSAPSDAPGHGDGQDRA